MTLNWIEQIIRWLGGAGIVLALAAIFAGLFRGLHKPTGRISGSWTGLLRSPLFYVLASLIYFGLCWLLWHPLPLTLSLPVRVIALIGGCLLFFPGLALVLWGRLTLGKQYFVSTTQGALLYAGHRLVTSGPYAWIRHPIYTGILLVGLGGLLIYLNWTFVLIALHFPGLTLRARREEEALKAEFGADWEDYCRRTPRFLPSLNR